MVKALAQTDASGIKVIGPFDSKKAYFISAIVEEGLSKITKIRIVFAIDEVGYTLDKLLGEKFHIEMKTAGSTPRIFRGTCIEAEYLGTAAGDANARGFDVFSVEVRTWPWFLTIAQDSRIFQEKSVPDIVKEVCADHGFSDITLKLSGTYAARTYTVQYDETDFDFISRLLEEEGIFFFFDHTSNVEKLILADSIGASEAIKETPTIEYVENINRGFGDPDTLFGWNDMTRAVPTKATLVDYNFTTPRTALDKSFTDKSSRKYKSGKEIYAMHGRYATTGDADHYSRVKGERQAHEAERWLGFGNVRTMAAGATFTLKGHPRVTGANTFLIVNATHRFQDQGSIEAMKVSAIDVVNAETDKDVSVIYDNQIEVIRKETPYRPPAVTPWPDLSGLHTATVTGPSGEEIYTDEYGRIKVQFHWDRDGKNDENTTCWVRVMQPWTGKGYGMVAIPRIGQEVVVQFERNNPDRPICIGMVYNAVNMPPYGLPDAMTQTTIRTESSKGGGGFNELVFEDKKDAEFVRLQSEKDYKEIIKNNAVITVGIEKADPGDMSLEVFNDQTEKIGHDQAEEVGNDRSRTVGNNETIDIGNDRTETVGNNQTESIGTDMSETVGSNRTRDVGADETVTVGSNQTLSVGSNQDTSVGSNQSLSVGSNQSVDIGSTGSITAGSKYEIKVGGSSITITPTSIELKSMKIVLDASMQVEVKGGISAKLQGGAMATVQGGLVKIN